MNSFNSQEARKLRIFRFAGQLSYYPDKILKRETIDMLLLQRIARILHYDFFDDLSQETFHRKGE